MVRGDTNHGYSSKWNSVLQLWPAACRLGHLSQLGADKFNLKNNETFLVISFRVPGVSVAKIRMVLGDTNHGYSSKWNSLLQLWPAACRLGHLSQLGAAKFNLKNNETFRVIGFRVPGVSVAKKRTVRGDTNHGCKVARNGRTYFNYVYCLSF